MGQLADRMTNRMAKEDVAIPLSMARTDGRTNERITHLPESSSVPERAGETTGEMDALSEFCAGLTPADVERERLAPLSKARLESFGGRAHRAMLATHELNRAKALRAGIVSDPLRQQAAAELEAIEYVRAKAKREASRRARHVAAEKAARRRVAPKFTREQIDAALAAMNNERGRTA